MKALRIGIDARPLHWPGIGRCIRELIEELAELDRDNRYFVYVSAQEARAPSFDLATNFTRVPVAAGVNTISEQIALPLRMWADRLDVFHAPTSLVVPVLGPTPMVVTVHDILLKLRPDYLPSRLARLYTAVINRVALQRACTLVAVSDFTRTEIARCYPRFAAKTRTVHNGVSPIFCPGVDNDERRTLLRRLGIDRGFVLYVGTLKQQKNVSTLVSAFAMLPDALRACTQLVLVTSLDPRYPEVARLIEARGLADSTVIVDDVCDAELIELYRTANVLAIPSTYEGFGLPVVEAMACATAVVVSDIPVFHEVAGEAAAYFDPADPALLAAALERVLDDAGYRAELGRRGLARAGAFTWRRVAQDMRKAYEDVAWRKTRAASSSG